MIYKYKITDIHRRPVILNILVCHITFALHEGFISILSFCPMNVFDRQCVYLDPVKRDCFEHFHFLAFNVQAEVIHMCAIQSG